MVSKCKKIVSLIVSVSVILSMCTVYVQGANENQFKIAFLGGSLTAGGEKWINATVDAVKTQKPQQEVVAINSGKGGTGSDYGAARFMNDIGQFAPDMVVVDFAVNDHGRSERDSKVYMESIVRQCLSLEKVPTVLFLYAPQPVEETEEKYSVWLQGVEWKEEIAEHYGIKSINVYDYMTEDYKAQGKYLNFGAYLGSMYKSGSSGYDVHGGYDKYAEAITKAFNEDYQGCMTTPKNVGIYCSEDSELINSSYEYININDPKLTFDGAWTLYTRDENLMTNDTALSINDGSYLYPFFENGVMQTLEGASFSFKSSADAFCLNYPSSTAGSSVSITVDGEAYEQKLSCWAQAQGVNYISGWFDLPGDGKEHDISVKADDPTDEKYVFRFGSVIERYKKSDNELTQQPENNEAVEYASFSGNTIFVSMDGDDEEGTGSFDNPFETIQAAKDAIRDIKENSGLPDGGICVYVREGVYNITEGLVFSEEDSGTETAPVTYRPYKDESVILIGGRKLSVKDFKRVSDENVLNRIYDKDARDCVYQYDLSRFPDFQYGAIYDSAVSGNKPNELVIDGQIMTISRWPNATASGDDKFEYPTIVQEQLTGGNFSFSIAETNRANNWKTANNVCLVANWRYLWQSYYDKITDIQNGVITTSVNIKGSPTAGVARFYALNLLEEIDVPGEFFVDRDNQKLYLYPPATSTADSNIFISELSAPIVTINGGSYLTFRGFEMPCSRGEGFRIQKGDNNLIAYCNIRNLGGNAVTVKEGTYNNGVVGNYVTLCDGGIMLSGGDVATLTPGNNYAENNDTSKFSRITKTYTGGIHVEGCGNRVSNNEIHDALHLGMQFGGNENIIEYNEFYDLLKSVDDSGGIYSGRTWIRRGNQITHNYFHDFYGSSGGVGLGCIYFDDWLAGNSVTKNIFENIPGRAMWAEGGSDNDVENNIMINVGTPIRYVDRGNSTETLANLTNSGGFAESLDTVPYNSEIWLEKYPIMGKIHELPVRQPHRVSIKKNVYVKSGNEDISQSVKDQGTYEDNISVGDPGFVDMENGDYTLKKDADIYTQIKGFEDTHFEKMGRYTDKLKKRVENAIVIGINRAGAFVNSEAKQIDDTNDAVMPIIINDRTMIPVRFVSESLGAEVSWNEEAKEIKITYNGKTIVMHIDNEVMTVDGVEVILDSAPVIREDRTLVPFRALAEALNKKVFWDDKGLVVISDNENIFDSVNDAYLIDDLLRRINLR